MSFVHLHTHTHYTFQQALGDPRSLARRAKENGQNAIAITDTGNMYGAFEFYQACREEDIKPIIGVEFKISKKGRKNREKNNEIYEIVLLAKNINGYYNLIQLVTRSQIEGYYNGQPRIDFELLEEYSSDIIALSGSLYGEIGQAIITGKSHEYLQERISYYQKIFGQENFFLELQEHPDRPMQSKVNEIILLIAKKCNSEYVATNNSYYLTMEDAAVQDIVSTVASGGNLDDPNRATLMNGDYSVRPSREMEELFVYAPRAYTNTEKIAEMIDLQIEYGEYKIPVFPLSEKDADNYHNYQKKVESFNTNAEMPFEILGHEEWILRKLCIDGLNTRYKFGLNDEEKDTLLQKIAIKKSEKKFEKLSVDDFHILATQSYSSAKKEFLKNLNEKKQEIIERLEYELIVVNMMGFNGYFCIVSDFIGYAKQNNIPVGPGRGSVAGAILAYLSGITDIDPLPYGLLFERFLNPARVTMPDIDVDFSDEGRDRVLTYVREKYGRDHVSQVCTFGTLAARAAVKDVGKVFGIPFQEMNDLAKLIPAKPGITLAAALETAPDFKKAYDTNERYKKIVDSAIRLEGTVRQLGVHACAVIIAPEPITHFCPVQPPPKDPTSTVTQFSAHPLEDLGLLKMDFLGLRNLTILDRAIKIVEDTHQDKIQLLDIDYEDPKVLELFSEGNMTGVFQFESTGMRRYLRELQPSSFEDLIAMVSLYRPGPMSFIPDFINRKHGKTIIEYPHPSLEEILKPTYGIAVYQEQIMQLVQTFAGFSLGEADILRRAIGKKKYDLLMEQRGKFLHAAKKQGHPEKLAIYIFDEIIEPFAGYGFNKSHAACYSMIAYQTAYMKTYYPTESITALMISDEEDTERIRMEITEARAQGIEVLPPDVNESRKHFTFIDATHIRFGLKAIKGLGDGPIDTIRKTLTQDGKFTSLENFIERTGGDVINKKSLEALIYSGALDAFGERSSLLKSIPKCTSYLKEIEHKQETSQMGLFDMQENENHTMRHLELTQATPLTFEEKMKGEKATIGYPISGHPLDGLEDFIHKKSKNLKRIFHWKAQQEIKQETKQELLSNTDADVEIKQSPNTFTESPAKETKETFDAQLIGLVGEVRTIPLKNGGNMLIATIESSGFDFTLTLFSKDFEIYAQRIQSDTIVVVDGRVRFNEERGEISISPRHAKFQQGGNTIRNFTISQFHQLAKNEGVKLPYEQPKCAHRYVVDIPPGWGRSQLLDMKSFLSTLPAGDIAIFIRINNTETFTKFCIQETHLVDNWIKDTLEKI